MATRRQIELFIAQAGTDNGAPVELQREIAKLLPELMEAAERLPIALETVGDLITGRIKAGGKPKRHLLRNAMILSRAARLYSDGTNAIEARAMASEQITGSEMDEGHLADMFPENKLREYIKAYGLPEPPYRGKSRKRPP